jgi:hypothetical protein
MHWGKLGDHLNFTQRRATGDHTINTNKNTNPTLVVYTMSIATLYAEQ